MSQILLEYLNAHREEMLSTLRRFVELESPSTDKAAIDRFSGALGEEFARLGCDVETLKEEKAGNNLRVSWPPRASQGVPCTPQESQPAGQVLVLTHMDTVWPVGEIEKRPFCVKDGMAYGPGVCDLKGGIVLVLFAIRALKDLSITPRNRVVMIFNSDEETGSHSSRALIEEEARRSKAVLVAEPAGGPEGALVTWRKGVLDYRLEVTGRASHAGSAPEAGISAIEEISRQIIALHALTNPETGTTVNVGVVEGGTRSNVVAAHASCEIDVRVMTMAEAERIQAAMDNLKPYLDGAKLTISGGLNRPPFPRTDKVLQLFELARRTGEDLGISLRESGRGGASDGNFTAAMGIPTIDGLGPVGGKQHAVDEFVVVDRMPERAALLASLIQVI